jgi:hypothetical protein
MKNNSTLETYRAEREATGDMPSIYRETSPLSSLRLQIGDVCCALGITDIEVYSWLKRLYHEYETDKSPDITVQLDTTDRLSLDRLEKSVFRSRFMQWRGRNFRTTHGIMSGKFDPVSRLIKIRAEKKLGNPQLRINHLNRLISLAYYTACKLKYNNVPPAMFVHSCGVLRHGGVFLFTGPSEVGKTTVARFCGEQDGEVINDEMVLVDRPGKNGGGMTVRGTPILGTFPPGRKISAPLRCIFLLKQSDRTQARALDQTEVYVRLLRQVISPACIGQKDKKTIYTIMADFSAEVVQAIPAYELEFQLDGDALWRTVADIEESLSKREAR